MEKMCLRAAFIGLLRFFLPKRWEKEERNGNEICGVMGEEDAPNVSILPPLEIVSFLDILRLLTA